MWIPLKLKIQEAHFFAEQLRAHTRYPQPFLFYLSAFLSSARSVTFHIQKQFSAPGKEVYDRLRSDLLSDEVCNYFVDLRNRSEKEGYPPVSLALLASHENPESGKLVWYQNAQGHLFSGRDDDEDAGLEFVQRILKTDWDLTSLSGPPVELRYVWKFPDFPGGETDVVTACEAFAERLWRFVAHFRAEWESAHDPDSYTKKFKRAFFLDA